MWNIPKGYLCLVVPLIPLFPILYMDCVSNLVAVLLPGGNASGFLFCPDLLTGIGNLYPIVAQDCKMLID